MRTYNVEQTIYSVGDETSPDYNLDYITNAICSNSTLTPEQRKVLIFCLKGPQSRSDLFNLSERFHLQHAAVDKALNWLVEHGYLFVETTRKLTPHTIRGQLYIDPRNGTMTFTPTDGRNQPFLTIQKVPFDHLDLDGHHTINYRHVPVPPKPVHIEPEKDVTKANFKPIVKPDPNKVCYICQKPLAKGNTLVDVFGRDGADHKAHKDCNDAMEQRKALFSLVTRNV